MLYRVHLDQRENRMYKHSHDRYWFHRQHIIPHIIPLSPWQPPTIFMTIQYTYNICKIKQFDERKQYIRIETLYRGECTSLNWTPFCDAWRQVFTYNISYCKDNIKCDSKSNAPKCPLNNGVSIFQKLVVKLSNTSTTFSQQVVRTLSKCFKRYKMAPNYEVHSPPCCRIITICKILFYS